MFSLETNASVRSRLTHSLEVSSIGRYVAQQALKAFGEEKKQYGIEPRDERRFITLVETACLLHDIGNPPFGHFGEIAISEWFSSSRIQELKPNNVAPTADDLFDQYAADFRHFDGNPQGLRICTKLQTAQTDDLNGLNLSAAALYATIKYPWESNTIGDQDYPWSKKRRKKCGFFKTETDVILWLRKTIPMVEPDSRHPLAYLMEAADDIAYCMSDIEDGIEKGLMSNRHFAEFVEEKLRKVEFGESLTAEKDKRDVAAIFSTLVFLKQKSPTVGGASQKFTLMQDLRSATIRLLARRAGQSFAENQRAILSGKYGPLLDHDIARPILDALKSYAEHALYGSPIVRNREITAHAVLFGILNAYLDLMKCSKLTFERLLEGKCDGGDAPLTRDRSLAARLAGKYLAVYRAEVSRSAIRERDGRLTVMERIHRIRLIVDYVASMTDEFALQTHQLISGTHVTPYRT